jgi:hypothetical protein
MLLSTIELEPKRPDSLERNSKIPNIKIKKMEALLLTGYKKESIEQGEPCLWSHV